MAPLSNTDGFQKDTEAVQVEKIVSHDATHTPKDLDAVLTEEEKKIEKKATYARTSIAWRLL
jgi:uncharacterized tellurite resistance protein B-like protein